ncbi:hypothetical protein FACS189494_05250 [Spirochaetia bacterium]|nr:hypothetical protein FACS189494_05250 [Spirochaetia bacterium]
MAKVFKLTHPVTKGELTVTEITLQRPKTKDFIAVGTLPADCAGADACLISSLSGLPESVINMIDIDDLAKLRFEIARVWESYFTGKPYIENPTPPPEAQTPEPQTAAESA